MKTFIIVILISSMLIVSDAQAQSYGQSYRLNSDLVAGGDVEEYILIPEIEQLAYLADQEADEMFGIYLTSLTPGGSSTRLNNKLLTNEAETGDIQIESNGIFVTAVIDDPGTGTSSTVTVPVVGTPLSGIQLSLNSGGFKSLDLSLSEESGIQLSQNKKYLVYLYDDNLNGQHDLFSLRLKPNSEPIKLNPTLPSNGHIFDFKLSKDSTKVVYRGDAETNSQTELFSIAIDGSTSAINIGPATTVFSTVTQFEITHDSQRVVFIGDLLVNNKQEVFSTPISSLDLIKLNGDLDRGRDAIGVAIAPDSQTVVYHADQDVNDAFELYKVSIHGGGNEKINSREDATTSTINQFYISSDGLRVVYVGRLSSATTRALYSRKLSLMEAEVTLSQTSNGNVESFRLSPDGSRVVYAGNLESANKLELFAISVSGAEQRIKLNDNLPGLSAVQLNYKISADSQRAIFLAPTKGRLRYDLFSSDLNGKQRQMISDNQFSQNGVESFAISNAGEFLVYTSDQRVANQQELFAAQLKTSNVNDDLCIPIKSENQKIVTICL